MGSLHKSRPFLCQPASCPSLHHPAAGAFTRILLDRGVTLTLTRHPKRAPSRTDTFFIGDGERPAGVASAVPCGTIPALAT